MTQALGQKKKAPPAIKMEKDRHPFLRGGHKGGIGVGWKGRSIITGQENLFHPPGTEHIKSRDRTKKT